MNTEQIEAYDYYKKSCPGAIVLFHIGTKYVALCEDAVKVAQSLTETSDGVVEKFEFPCDDLNAISKLGDSFQLCMVDYRNDDGELDFPDVKRLKQEKREDY